MNGGVVVCSPLHAEFQTNYRREVLLGRALAARGVAVHRFHYRGTGHSEGDPRDVTLASMAEDAMFAVERLVERVGVPRVAFVGTRLGALVAASAAATRESAPVALWEPVPDGARYFKDMFRATRILGLKEGSVDDDGSALGVEAFHDLEMIDVIGYSVHRPLFESSRDRTLTDCLGHGPGRVLIVQLGRGHQLRREYRDLLATLEERGSSADSRLIFANEAWWFSNDPTRAAPLSTRVVDATSDWLVNVLTEAGFG